VLYDTSGAWGWLGATYATEVTGLASHFGARVAHPVSGYVAGELAAFTAVVYIGSTYDEPLPRAFLDDVLSTRIRVVWVYDNIWQLSARAGNFSQRYGFTWKGFDYSAVSRVDYHGTTLKRDTTNGSGIMDELITDPALASVPATALRPDGSGFPWAVRSGNFTYLGEIPLAYTTHDDRYLAFCDLLFDALVPGANARHPRGVLVENVGPDTDPAQLYAIANYLHSRKVSLTVAVYPSRRDPKGTSTNGVPEDYPLAYRPKVVSALKYLQSPGGTLLMCDYTRPYQKIASPVGTDDVECYTAHIDANNSVVYDEPVPLDPTSGVGGRLTSAQAFTARLKPPTIFEPPHQAASALH
jgi:uncharacterized protein YdaL